MKIFFKNGTDKEFKKRNVTLTDMSENVVSLTLWTDKAQNFKGKIGELLLIDNAAVKKNLYNQQYLKKKFHLKIKTIKIKNGDFYHTELCN